MNAVKILINSFGSLAIFAAVANAQEETLQLKFEGSCRSTNESGLFVRQIVNNRTLLKEYAQKHSVSNLNSLALVYHVNGDERGDVIEIVNAFTGDVLEEVLALFFSINLPTGDGSQVLRQTSIFNSQQPISIGCSLLKEQFVDKKGNPKHTITGDLQYYLLPDADHGLRLCTANIQALKPFTLKEPPRTNTTSTIRGTLDQLMGHN